MPRKVRYLRDLRRLAAHALLNGATVVSPTRVYWDAAGGCENPYPFTLEGRGPQPVGRDEWGRTWLYASSHEELRPYLGSKEYGYDGVLWLDMDVPCRRCDTCLRRRAAGWAFRAKSEISVAPRTWFGTLTARPGAQFSYQARATVRLEKRGTEWASLTADEQFKERALEMGREATKWLKRVRKESGAPLRYILVSESHQTGLPHLHLLMHEVDAGRPVRWGTLSRQWTEGFSQFKLIDDSRPAWYVCKYLSKAALTRVRASRLYGKQSLSEHSKSNRITF